MRSLTETCTRWNATISENSNLSDLKAAVSHGNGQSPCDVGLRSICWKAFLVFGNLDRSTWSKTLSNSRSAYTSLREHFLRDIEHADDLAAADPLADDESSPWNTLRRDEILRDEIYQDVERCMPDNLFFREPKTQSTLLDILFIFCKLNADIGYRQGMHEVLAPILWVVSTEAIDPGTLKEKVGECSELELVKEALNYDFVEHDTFTIYCVIMQAVKSFYEMSGPTSGGSQHNSPIVERSRRIHEEILRKADPELAQHLTEIEVLPQIFIIRWIRLLFGREFPFDDVLSLWDVLFAEDPALDLIDFVCVAMLLRVRWQLIEADYSSALTLLLRYPAPPESQRPATFVKDALYLHQNLSPRRGSHIITKYSGRSLQSVFDDRPGSYRGNRTRKSTLTTPDLTPRPRSPLISPSRFLQEQGGIEGILQEAAKGVYNHGEKWGVNRALRGAVQGLQQSGSSSPRRLPLAGVRWSLDDGKPTADPGREQLTARVEALEQRNKSLAKILENAIEDLWVQQRSFDKEKAESPANALSLVIAKIQFVQVYLEDPLVPLVPDHKTEETAKKSGSITVPISATNARSSQPAPVAATEIAHEAQPTAGTYNDTMEPNKVDDARELSSSDVISPAPSAQEAPSTPPPITTPASQNPKPGQAKDKPLPSPFTQSRPSLASSSFSWMLGPDQRKSSFISVAHFPPEKRRESAVRAKNGFLFGDDDEPDPGFGAAKGKNKYKAKEKGDDEDGNVFTMGTLKGLPERIT